MFIEVERLMMHDDKAAAVAARAEIIAFLTDLGIDKKELVEKGYDVLLYQQKGRVNSR